MALIKVIPRGAPDVKSGRKNLIINGGMQVSQRGTSTTGNSNASGFYACDRVKLFNINAGPTYTVTQDTSAPAGFVNSFKVQCTTADTSLPADHYTILRTGLIERSDMVQAHFGTSSAKSLTYSFWVKSNKTGNQLVMFVDHKNQKEIGQVFNIAVADTWEKKVITVIGNTGSSFDNSSSSGLTVDFYLAVGTNRSGGSTPTAWGDRVTINAGATNLGIADSTANYFQITGVQLELGSVATDFEYRSYGEELSLCQRYFERLTYTSGMVLVALQHGSTSGIIGITHSEKRSTPTITLPTAANTNIANGISLLTSEGGFRTSAGAGTAAASTGSVTSFRIVFSSWPSSGSAGDATWCYFTSSTGTSHIDIAAEL